jgi:hypothetical protein
MKFWWRHHIASFALNGLNEDGGHFLRRYTPFEKVFTNPINTGNTATRIFLMMIWTAITIRIGDMGHPGDKWGKPPFVNYFASC